jgi:hypothetical protein
MREAAKSVSRRWAVYRGINLNGPAVEIDGHTWDGDKAANFSCANRAVDSPQVRLRPPTDEARAKMIHAFRWDRRASLTLTAVPAGTYAVYASKLGTAYCFPAAFGQPGLNSKFWHGWSISRMLDVGRNQDGVPSFTP